MKPSFPPLPNHHKSPLLSLLLLLLTLFLSGCAVHRTLPTNYYILEYYPHLEQKQLVQDTPFPYSVQVMETNVPRTYNRKQLVIRHFGPKITYADRDLWSIKPGEAVPNLIAKRLTRYGTFRQVQRDFLDTPPDLELITVIHNLELLEFQRFPWRRGLFNIWDKKKTDITFC
jgi:ABC-type uncharacterized transport system auxiliary subunit